MKGCFKAALFVGIAGLGSCALLIGSCVYLAYREIKNLPPESRREILYPQHRELIEYLDGVIHAAPTLEAAGKAFSENSVAEDVLYIVANPKSSSLHSEAGKVEFLKRGAWTGQSYFTNNGAGYGSISDKFSKVPVFVISSTAKLANGSEVSYLIFIRDRKATAVESEPAK